MMMGNISKKNFTFMFRYVECFLVKYSNLIAKLVFLTLMSADSFTVLRYHFTFTGIIHLVKEGVSKWQKTH